MTLQDDLLDGAAAIAAFIGKSDRMVYHMASTGQLPVIRKGRRIYARRSELEAAFRSAAAYAEPTRPTRNTK